MAGRRAAVGLPRRTAGHVYHMALVVLILVLVGLLLVVALLAGPFAPARHDVIVVRRRRRYPLPRADRERVVDVYEDDPPV